MTRDISKRNAEWTRRVRKLLLNKKIVAVHFMTVTEQKECGWDEGAVLFQLSTGEWVYPSRDDEGNGPGSLFTTSTELPIIPVLDNG
jgi:hypothetical protein